MSYQSPPPLFSTPVAPLLDVPHNLKSAGNVSIKGYQLVVPDGYMFPPLCILSGATTGLGPSYTQQVTYNPRGTVAALFGGIIGALIAGTGKVQQGCFSFCVSHEVMHRRRRNRIIAAVISALLVIFMVVGLKTAERRLILYIPFTLIVLIFSLTMAFGRTQKKLRLNKIKDGKLYLSGLSRKVRQQILEFEYRRLQAVRRAAEENQARARAQAAAAAGAPGPAIPPPLPPPLPEEAFAMQKPAGYPFA